MQREYDYYWNIAGPMFTVNASHPLNVAYTELLKTNDDAWSHNEHAVPAALAHRSMQDNHAAAIRLNKDRVRLKNVINKICGSASTEIKSYYEDQA